MKTVTPSLISFLKQVNHYLSTVEVLKKIYQVENFHMNILKGKVFIQASGQSGWSLSQFSLA